MSMNNLDPKHNSHCIEQLAQCLKEADHVILDTCVYESTLYSIKRFLEGDEHSAPILDNALREADKKLLMVYEVLGEIRHHILNNPTKKNVAENALNRIRRLKHADLFSDTLTTSSGTGDGDEAILRWCKAHPDDKNLIVTQDVGLACRLEALNSARGADAQHVEVRRVSGKSGLEYHCGAPIHPRKQGTIQRYAPSGDAPAFENETLPVTKRPAEGSELVAVRPGGTHTMIRLAESIGFGAEAEVYAVENTTLCAKIFEAPTLYQKAKVDLLMRRAFEIEGCVFPEAMLYCDDCFVGYLMKKVDSIPIGALFTDRGREKHAPHWDRHQFATAAKKVVDLFSTLAFHGITVGDVNDQNLRVFLTENEAGEKVPDPNHIVLIDLDSAQIGASSREVYPAAGYTPEYAAPEVLQAAHENRSPAFDELSDRFSATLLALRCIMTGVHPFRSLASDPAKAESLADKIRLQKFPFGSQASRRDAVAIGGSPLIWSWLPKSLKRLWRSSLTASDRSKRVYLKTLSQLLRYYEGWLLTDEEGSPQEKATLFPTRYKCCNVVCANCGITFDIANASGAYTSHSNLHYCPICHEKYINSLKFDGGLLKWTPQTSPAEDAESPAEVQTAPAEVAQTIPAESPQAAPWEPLAIPGYASLPPSTQARLVELWKKYNLLSELKKAYGTPTTNL